MANGWYENAAYDFVVEPAEGSDDVGGSLGRGNPALQELEHALVTIADPHE